MKVKGAKEIEKRRRFLLTADADSDENNNHADNDVDMTDTN